MICLSFDTDHMSEARMREFLSVVPIPGQATFFCTQRYECIDAGEHEIAPHPAPGDGDDWAASLSAARDDFPDAQGCRPHSCTWSHMLALQLAEQGYTYVSCHDQIGRQDIVPHREAWGLWQMPIYYMDTLDLSAPRFWPERGFEPFSTDLIDTAVEGDALFVFGFHPVHLLLNSTSVEAYLERREAFTDGAQLSDLRHPGFGAGEFFRALTERMDEAGEVSRMMREALAEYTEPSVAATPPGL